MPRYYDLMGIKEYYMRLSLPDMNKLDKYVDEPDKWVAALDIIKQAMAESGYPYVEGKGEAAFYGPKIDFMIKSAIGTEYTISTNQLDFLATETFDLKYVGEDGAEHPVYVIHRAPLGTHERFTAFLIEHYAGAFPVWLAPVQARIVPISEKVNEFAEKVRQALFDEPVVNGTAGLRVDVDWSSERMQKKIRDAQLRKIPLYAGGRRARGGRGQGRRPPALGQGFGRDAARKFHKTHQGRGGIPQGCGRLALANRRIHPILPAVSGPARPPPSEDLHPADEPCQRFAR